MSQSDLTHRMAIPPQIEQARRMAEAELQRRHALGESISANLYCRAGQS